MSKKKVLLDLFQLETGYHRFLRDVFGRQKPLLTYNCVDDLVFAIQQGSLPAPIAEENTKKIFNALSALSAREQDVVERYYGLNWSNPQTLEEIAKIHKLTRERIRQIKARSFRKLRHPDISRQLVDIPEEWVDVQIESSVLKNRLRETQEEFKEYKRTVEEELAKYREAAKTLYSLSPQAELNKEQEERLPLLAKPVSELELSVRSANCLEVASIKTIRDLVTKTESEMLHYRDFGRKSLNEIKLVLNEMGLSFGMVLPEE